MISSKSVPSQNSIGVLGKEMLFLATGMRDDFRAELRFLQDEAQEQRKGWGRLWSRVQFSGLEPWNSKERP